MIRYFLILSLSYLVNTLPDVKIIGGSAANITDFPYQVSLREWGNHVCGGSILTESYILTAAHCTYGHPAICFTVRTGSSFVNSGGQISQVQQIFYHEKYDKTGYKYDYDIAVLKLRSPLQFGISARSIRLASSTTIIETDHLQGVASGWGSTISNGPASVQLQSVVLPYISLESCRTYYPKELTETMFCAGYPLGGKDTCQGDSGGGYVVSGILLGITSWGYGCAEPNQPGVFTNITILRDFVDNILNK